MITDLGKMSHAKENKFSLQLSRIEIMKPLLKKCRALGIAFANEAFVIKFSENVILCGLKMFYFFLSNKDYLSMNRTYVHI